MKDPTLFAVVHAGIWLHPKLRHLAQDLDVEDVTAVGHLVALWTSALAQAPDGVLHRWRPRDVADLSRWRGSADAFVGALLEHGWLEQDKQGVFVVAGWCEYAGRGLTERAKELDRKKRYREKQKDGPRDGNGTSPETPANTKRDVREEREREREREREKESESAARPSPPPAVATPIPEPAPETFDDRLLERSRGAVVADNRNARNLSLLKAEAIYGRPQTVEALLAHMVDGEPLERMWSRRFEALDGKAGRPTVAEKVAVLWEAHAGKRWGVSGATVIAWFVSKLGEDNDKHRRAWERDGGARNASAHPLWATWRNLKNSQDVPPFEEWLRQRDDRPQAPMQQGSGRQPQGPASGATAVARVVTAVLDEQEQTAATVFNDEASYKNGLALMHARQASMTPATTKTAKKFEVSQ